MNNITRSHWPALLAMLFAVTQIPSAHASGGSDASDQSRFSRSVEGRMKAQGAPRSKLSEATPSGYEALRQDGPRIAPGRATTEGGKTAPVTAASNRPDSHETVDFMIYDASSELFHDFDHDGYFYGFAVIFDADVSEGIADVYAELYLSRNGGPWNRYFTTRVFSIFGAGGDDTYEVVTELDTGYPPGDYDVLIELYDAETGDFLTDYGPADDAALSYLPLEDANYDTPVYYEPYYGGGGTGPAMLILLTLLVAWRQRQRDRSAFPVKARGPRDPG